MRHGCFELPARQLAFRPARCSTWNILSLADVPRGTFFRPEALKVERHSAARESSSAPDRESRMALKTPMFHVEHFKLCRCSTWNIFHQRPPLRPSAAPTARESLGSSERIADGSRRPRCSKWNRASFSDILRVTFSAQKPGVLPKQSERTSPYGEIADGSRRPRCSTWNILSFANVPRGTFSTKGLP